MTTATISPKGQITLPKLVRDLLNLKVGDRVAFREREDGAIVVEAETVSLLKLRGSVRSRVRGVTVDDMKAAVRRRAR